MFGPVREGIYYFSKHDFDRGDSVKVWYLAEGVKRGWHCTPQKNGRSDGHVYPLSPDIWDYLYSEAELRAATEKRPGEHSRDHMGFTK